MKRLVDALAPGLRVFVSGSSGEPALLQDELRADPERARGVTFEAVQFPAVDRADYLAVHPEAKLRAYFMSPAVRAGLALGAPTATDPATDSAQAPAPRAELFALDYRGIARHLLEQPPADVAIAQLSLPDADGFCSLGVASDFLPLVWPRAKKRAAQLNARMPRTRGSFRVHVSEIDVAVEADLPLLTFAEGKTGDVEARIGAHVAGLIRDGDTLQFGIGSVPVALASALTSHRRLRFHGGMASPAVRLLAEAGALDPGARITTGVLLGDQAFYDFAARLEPLWLTDVTHTHSPAALASVPRFIAINSAVEVDLFGQVNSERASGALLAGSGGLPAFAEAALASPGGRLLVCLTATARKGTVSRIVPALDASALCTIPRHLVDVVVTEHGAAELRGLSLDARAQALVAIAAPEHRAALSRAWSEIRARA